jgi:uroporphyrinogen-III synthase
MSIILITRPIAQSKEIAKNLKIHGFKTFIEPVFEVKKKPINKNLKNFKNIVITSSNAIEAIVDNFNYDIKIFTVGQKTAQKLIEKGFKNVLFPKKENAKNLLKLIIKNHKNNKEPILYLHGSKITIDFSKELKKYRITAKKTLCYKIKERVNFSKKLTEFSKKKSFDFVLIYSSNSAEIFFKLVKKNNLLEYFNNSQILGFSEEISKKLKFYGFKKCSIFAKNLALKKIL